MPKLVMSMIQQATRKLTPKKQVPVSLDWPSKPILFEYTGEFTQVKGPDGVRSTQGIIQREGRRYSVHRWLMFQLWDDRHAFDWDAYRKDEARAKAYSQDFLEERSARWSGQAFPYLWRSTTTPNFMTHRSVWMCVHQRELFTAMPIGHDKPTFTLGLHTREVGKFGGLEETPVPRNLPYLMCRFQVKAIGKRSLHNADRKPTWQRPIELVHPEVVGPDRILMMALYLNGASDAEMWADLKNHKDYVGYEPSDDYRKKHKMILKGLYR